MGNRSLVHSRLWQSTSILDPGGAADQMRNQDQGCGIEEEGSGYKQEMTVAQILEQEFGGDKYEGGVGDPE